MQVTRHALRLTMRRMTDRMMHIFRVVCILLLLVFAVVLSRQFMHALFQWQSQDLGRNYLPTLLQSPNQFQGEAFSFVLAADMRQYAGSGVYNTPEYFRGALVAARAQKEVSFIIIPGDLDPAPGVYWTITSTLGITFPYYPVIGNHELPGDGNESEYGANLDWLNSYDYGVVNPGPPACPHTTYSFDVQNAHFTVLNEYCDSASETATSGDIPDYLYTWLEQDLTSTDKPFIFVVGHEPAYVQPDADNGRLRHLGDSLDLFPVHRDRFWNLLVEQGVIAYLCGHTHNYSAVPVYGVWQIDAGHARGLGDTGARSTFVVVHVESEVVWFEAYRDDANGGAYTLRHHFYIHVPYAVFIPAILN